MIYFENTDVLSKVNVLLKYCLIKRQTGIAEDIPL